MIPKTNREIHEERERRSSEKLWFVVIVVFFALLLFRACEVEATSGGSMAERQVIRDLDRIAAAQERIAAALEKQDK